MSSKRHAGSSGGNSLPAGASDSAWLSTSDRLDFAFKKRTEKIDWRRIGNIIQLKTSLHSNFYSKQVHLLFKSFW